MSGENVEIVRRGYALFSAGDIEGVAALFADDAEVPDGGGLGVTGTAEGVRIGPEGFLRNVEETLEAFEDYTVKSGEPIEVGDAVVVPVRILGSGRASGARLEMRAAHLWVLRDGQVIRGEVFRTAEEALQVARLETLD
jgi:uncharacterized protein